MLFEGRRILVREGKELADLSFLHLLPCSMLFLFLSIMASRAYEVCPFSKARQYHPAPPAAPNPEFSLGIYAPVKDVVAGENAPYAQYFESGTSGRHAEVLFVCASSTNRPAPSPQSQQQQQQPPPAPVPAPEEGIISLAEPAIYSYRFLIATKEACLLSTSGHAKIAYFLQPLVGHCLTLVRERQKGEEEVECRSHSSSLFLSFSVFFGFGLHRLVCSLFVCLSALLRRQGGGLTIFVMAVISVSTINPSLDSSSLRSSQTPRAPMWKFLSLHQLEPFPLDRLSFPLSRPLLVLVLPRHYHHHTLLISHLISLSFILVTLILQLHLHSVTLWKRRVSMLIHHPLPRPLLLDQLLRPLLLPFPLFFFLILILFLLLMFHQFFLSKDFLWRIPLWSES